MNPASNLILIGPMGSGKTSIGRRLARRLDLHFVDMDQQIEQRSGASINLIFELDGEPGFRRRESELLTELCAGEGQLIATGGGVVLNADNRALIRRSGFVVFLDIDVDQQLRRLSRDQTRPLLRSPDRRQRLLDMAAMRRPLYQETADLVFACGHTHAAQAGQRLADLLDSHWQQKERTHVA